MSRLVGSVLTFGAVLTLTGCAHVSTVGRGSSSVGVFFGDRGITGHGNSVTVQNGSRLTKLSVIGDDNTVMVEDQVTLPHVEFWGSNNTVSVPEYLMLRVTEVGRANKIIRRPVIYDATRAGESPYVPPRTPRTMPAPAETTSPAAPPPPVTEERTFEPTGEGEP